MGEKKTRPQAMKITGDKVVRITYRIIDKDGRLLEERTPENSYEYLHGRGHIVPPVEFRLEGKTIGFRDEIFVSPREAYGDYQPNLVAELKRAHFPLDSKVEVGMKFNTLNANGQSVVVRIIEIEDDRITVDGNHPLAGLELIFEVRVLGVREATADELTSGRAAVTGSSSVVGKSEGLAKDTKAPKKSRAKGTLH